MKRNWLFTLCVCAVVGLVCTPASYGAIVHIAKSYPQIERINAAGDPWVDGTDDPDHYEFRVNNVQSMRDAWTWSGGEALRNGLDSWTDPATSTVYNNMSMFIFEDSGVYNVHDDVQAYAATPTDRDNLFFDWWGMFFDETAGFGASGQGGIVIMAADGEMPTIDYTTVVNAQWGSGRNFMLSANHKAGQIFYFFDGLRFVENDTTSGGGWGTGVQSNGGDGTVPGFRNCVFEIAHQTFGAGGGQTHAMLNGPEYWHCAFNLLNTGGGERVFRPDASSGFNGGDGSIDFEQCTFIAASGTVWELTQNFSGGGDAYTVSSCILNGVARVHETNADLVLSYTDNLEWPELDTAMVLQSESGTIVTDPLFANTAAADFWLLTASSPAAAAVPANNIGYDIWTASGEEPPPAGEVPVAGGLTLGLLGAVFGAVGLVAARRARG